MVNASDLPRHTAFSALSSASNLLLLLLVIMAGRVLGDSDYGKFSLALAVASVFEMPIDFGLSTLTVKNVARDRGLAAAYLHSILPSKAVISAAVMFALLPTAFLLARSFDGRVAIMVMGLAIVLRSLKSTVHAFFRSYERFDLILLTTYTERLSIVPVCALVLLASPSLMSFVWAYALARIPDLVFSFWLMHRSVVRVGWRWDPAAIRNIQIEALPFGSLNIITVLYAYIGTVILGALRSPAEVGWYSAGYRIYEGLTMFPFILSSVLLPRLSRFFATDRLRHASLAARGLKYTLVLSLPIAACGYILAPQILTLIFGAEYQRGAGALRMLFLASVFMFANWLLNTILISTDRQGIVLRVTGTGLAVSVAAHVVLVSLYGALGAGIASFIAEFFVFAMYIVISRNTVFSTSLAGIVWKPVVSCLASSAVFFIPWTATVLQTLALFVAVYCMTLIPLRTFDGEEWSALRSIFTPNT